METKLVVVGGKSANRSIRLSLPTTIGRGKEAGLTVAHTMISRKHCELFEADGVVMLRDLGSLNGTLVEGRRIRELPLRPDQQFTVGPVTFRVEYEYRGDLEAALAAQMPAEEARYAPEIPESFPIDDVTPYDPKNFREPAPEPDSPGSSWAQSRNSEPTPPPVDGRWASDGPEEALADTPSADGEGTLPLGGSGNADAGDSPAT